ncbi:hypothetical protein BF0836 [Bacteroides fragilis YCH46]|uniref:Transmembrane protein n=1 Tax=Bacteroides fragilis (strain YCH46) TaxID=295405 RepID=Q64Y39_BACFR|nr:hypothetical protein BF0836 [Bacteroides fragilis YCH46]
MIMRKIQYLFIALSCAWKSRHKTNLISGECCLGIIFYRDLLPGICRITGFIWMNAGRMVSILLVFIIILVVENAMPPMWNL